MNKILLSADSTCDLGEEIKSSFHIEFFPYHIILDGKDYLDNVTITTKDIYDRYDRCRQLPKTAAINISEYIDYFSPYVKQGYDVVHFCLGSALSSSYQNCMLAARQLGHVYPIDSCSLSTGLGLQVLDAYDYIQDGLSATQIQSICQQSVTCYHASFILDTLEFLHAGGRCSAISALGASLLTLKPCILVDNTSGAMRVGKKYRGKLDRVLPHYVTDELSSYNNIVTNRIFITHSGIDSAYIELVKETITKHLDFKNIYITNASCTISAHCGPNTLGILFKTESKVTP